jgi:septum formation protein
MKKLILASTSLIRMKLLTKAGIIFETKKPIVDEERIRTSMQSENKNADIVAKTLAIAKAMNISQKIPQAYILGCDQVLCFENELIGKSNALSEAHQLLERLRGKSHRLLTAAALIKDCKILWQFCACAELKMWDFSDDFLRSYLQAETEDVLNSVGCYRLEEKGIQLFENIEGDYFSILGLPLVPVLTALREFGVTKQCV